MRKLDANVYAPRIQKQLLPSFHSPQNERIIQQQHFSVTRIAVGALKIHNLCEFDGGGAGVGANLKFLLRYVHASQNLLVFEKIVFPSERAYGRIYAVTSIHAKIIDFITLR
jgi:hypothetical protein